MMGVLGSGLEMRNFPNGGGITSLVASELWKEKTTNCFDVLCLLLR